MNVTHIMNHLPTSHIHIYTYLLHLPSSFSFSPLLLFSSPPLPLRARGRERGGGGGVGELNTDTFETDQKGQCCGTVQKQYSVIPYHHPSRWRKSKNCRTDGPTRLLTPHIPPHHTPPLVAISIGHRYMHVPHAHLFALDTCCVRVVHVRCTCLPTLLTCLLSCM